MLYIVKNRHWIENIVSEAMKNKLLRKQEGTLVWEYKQPETKTENKKAKKDKVIETAE